MLTCYLAHPAVVQHTVQGLESAMTDLVLVEVRHSSGDVCGEGKPGGQRRESHRHAINTLQLLLLRWSSPEAPVQGDLLVQEDVMETSLWAVLCYYGNVGHVDASADELTQVRMIELPEQRDRVTDVFSSG